MLRIRDEYMNVGLARKVTFKEGKRFVEFDFGPHSNDRVRFDKLQNEEMDEIKKYLSELPNY